MAACLGRPCSGTGLAKDAIILVPRCYYKSSGYKDREQRGLQYSLLFRLMSSPIIGKPAQVSNPNFAPMYNPARNERLQTPARDADRSGARASDLRARA